MPILQLGEPLVEEDRGPPHALEKTGRQHDVEHRVARRHRQRIAAERRAVAAGGHALGRLLGGETGSEREAAADRLGDGHDVRLDPGALIREQLAGAPDAGLHFIEQQQQALLIAQGA